MITIKLTPDNEGYRISFSEEEMRKIVRVIIDEMSRAQSRPELTPQGFDYITGGKEAKKL